MIETKDEVIKILSFDGQTIWLDRQTLLFEVGNFLGGGAAGTVYECEQVKTHEHYALKILNPIGYKLISPALLKRCTILIKVCTTLSLHTYLTCILSLSIFTFYI